VTTFLDPATAKVGIRFQSALTESLPPTPHADPATKA